LGTWGVGIFQDDLAKDLRATWTALYAGLESPEAATAELIETWRSSLADPDVGPNLWLALATMKWRYGCLDEPTLARALQIIDSGLDAGRWAETDARTQAARTAALAAARAELTSRQPALKRVRRKTLERAPFKPGQLVRFTRRSGEIVLVWVTRHYRHVGAILPEVVVLRWLGRELPDRDSILALRPVVRSDIERQLDWDQDTGAAAGTPPERISEHLRAVAEAGYTRYVLFGSDRPNHPRHRIAVVQGEYSWDLPHQPDGPGIMLWVGLETLRELEPRFLHG
jgi:hypothetical protein